VVRIQEIPEDGPNVLWRSVMNKDEQNDFLNRLAGALIRCFFLAYVLLLIWFFFYWLTGDFGYRITSLWFRVSPHEYDLMSYCGIAFVKICTILFFLIPYVAIRMVVRRKKG
jgi:hypothetical protein